MGICHMGNILGIEIYNLAFLLGTYSLNPHQGNIFYGDYSGNIFPWSLLRTSKKKDAPPHWVLG